jgi:hypothetical protein
VFTVRKILAGLKVATDGTTTDGKTKTRIKNGSDFAPRERFGNKDSADPSSFVYFVVISLPLD